MSIIIFKIKLIKPIWYIQYLTDSSLVISVMCKIHFRHQYIVNNILTIQIKPFFFVNLLNFRKLEKNVYLEKGLYTQTNQYMKNEVWFRIDKWDISFVKKHSRCEKCDLLIWNHTLFSSYFFRKFYIYSFNDLISTVDNKY